MEACLIHEQRLNETPELFDPVVGPRMLQDREIKATDYVKALRRMHELRREAAHSLRDVDVLAVPATMVPALPVAQADADMEAYTRHVQLYVRNCRVGNLLDLCGVVLPCGFTAKGLPIGLMLQGKPFSEAAVLRAAHAYEQATEWHTHRPVLAWAG